MRKPNFLQKFSKKCLNIKKMMGIKKCFNCRLGTVFEKKLNQMENFIRSELMNFKKEVSVESVLIINKLCSYII